jgi:hypothetical protein
MQTLKEHFSSCGQILAQRLHLHQFHTTVLGAPIFASIVGHGLSEKQKASQKQEAGCSGIRYRVLVGEIVYNDTAFLGEKGMEGNIEFLAGHGFDPQRSA